MSPIKENKSPKNSPIKNPCITESIISADSIFSQAVESEENLARLSSVSAMSENILSNGNIHAKLEKLVKPSVRVSKQVEFFAKMLHSRNADFVDYFRQIKGTLKSKESFYFHDEDIEKAFQASDVDLHPVVEELTAPDLLEPKKTTPKKDLKKSLSVEDHVKWNTFLKDISQLTIEIDDDTESFL